MDGKRERGEREREGETDMGHRERERETDSSREKEGDRGRNTERESIYRGLFELRSNMYA